MAVTLDDVAKLAGVSPRTVSNVVNDYPFVAEATRQRVLDAIAKLGYQPNLAARNLRRGRSGMVALVVPELGVPYFSELASAVIEEVDKRSTTLVIEQTNGDPDRERIVLSQRGGRVFDGFIFSPLGLGAGELRRIGTKAPIVLLGERIDEGPFDHVTMDNVGAARSAVEHLISLGRHRIAAIGDQPFETGETAQLRTAGYREALAAAGISYEPELVISTPHFHRAIGAAAMETLLERPEPPDAVFCYNDLLAAGALRTVLTRGLRVPDDIAIAGFDDIEEGRYLTPSLTTVSPDKQQIATRAVQQLFERIDGSEADATRYEVPFQLVIRESTVGLRTGSPPS